MSSSRPVFKEVVSHPEFLSNPFYVAGDSYAGIFVPIITQMISNGNEAGLEPSINLKGCLAGNPKTYPAESNFSIPFSHGMGLISDELYEGTIGTWVRCNRDSLAFEFVIWDVRPCHANLSTKGYRSLVYSGDHDFLVPFQSTQAWIRDLNYSIIDVWRPWIVDGQYAGYTRAYSNKMTFATVKGGGHTAPEYRPPQCYAMFERWISNKPL